MKDGWKTTEFWVTVFSVLSSLLASYGGLISGPAGVVVSAVVTAGYSISRGLAKKG